MRRVLCVAAAVVVLGSGGGAAHAAAAPTPAPAPSATAAVSPSPTSPAAPAPKPSGAATATPAPATPTKPATVKDKVTGAVDDAVGKVTGKVEEIADAVCTRPPLPQHPRSTVAGKIDPGPANPRTGGGMYEQRGFSGFQLPIYDPGCTPGTTAIQKRVFDGPNTLAEFILGTSLAAVSVAVVVTRVAVVPGGAWNTIDAALRAAGIAIDPRVIGGLLMVGAAFAAVLIAVRNNRDADLPDTAAKSAGMFGIAAVALMLLGNVFFIGPTFDKATSETFTAVTAASSGETADVPADVVVGNAALEGVVWPTYVDALLGADTPSNRAFAQRLYAAGSYTREEAAMRERLSPQARAMFDQAKQANYRQAADELKTADATAYAHLSGTVTTPRAGAALIGLLATLLVSVPLTVSTGLIGVARALVRAVVWVFPFGAIFWVFPAAQATVPALLVTVARWVKLAAVGAVTYLVSMSVVVRGVLRTEMDMSMRLVGLVIVTATGVLLWAAAKKTAEARAAAADVERVKKAAKKSAEAVAPVFAPATAAVNRAADRVEAAAGRRMDLRSASHAAPVGTVTTRSGRRVDVDTLASLAARNRDVRAERARRRVAAHGDVVEAARAAHTARVESSAAPAPSRRSGRRLRRADLAGSWTPNASTAGVAPSRTAPVRRPLVKKAAAGTAAVVAPAPVKGGVAVLSTARKVMA